MDQLAVLFDVDGVLVDSYQPHFESWRTLFAELGFDYSESDFQKGFGRTSNEILDDWSAEHGCQWNDVQKQDIDDRKEALYRQMIASDFPAIDGAAELVKSLSQAEFRIGIGSSGPPENVAVVVETMPGGELFEEKVTRADITRGKPNPEVFLTGAQRLGIPPRHCAVIEDAVPGIQAANAAQMVSIALVGTATREALAEADLVVDSLRELSPSRIESLIGANLC